MTPYLWVPPVAGLLSACVLQAIPALQQIVRRAPVVISTKRAQVMQVLVILPIWAPVLNLLMDDLEDDWVAHGAAIALWVNTVLLLFHLVRDRWDCVILGASPATVEASLKAVQAKITFPVQLEFVSQRPDESRIKSEPPNTRAIRALIAALNAHFIEQTPPRVLSAARRRLASTIVYAMLTLLCAWYAFNIPG